MTTKQEKARHLLAVARDIAAAVEHCFLTTNTPSGWPRTRLMQPFPLEDDFTIWFGASPRSRKAAEIARDHRATVAFGDAHRGAYVALSGAAAVDHELDQRLKYWRPEFSRFWPSGPDGADYVLIRFKPSRIELMDLERQVAPTPFGLKPAVLVLTGDGWELEEE